MKVTLLVLAWVIVGGLVALRGARPPWERALAVAFWPFFLAAGVPSLAGVAPAGRGPVARLSAALAPDDPAQRLVGELAQALARQQARVERLDEAIAASGPEPGEDPALAAARARSRELLASARGREHGALVEALAAVEETATRLWLLRERGQRGEVEALLRGLAARLRASEEVEAAPGGKVG